LEGKQEMKEVIHKIIQADLYRYGGIKNESQLSYMTRKELYGYKYTKVMRLCKFHKDNNHRLRFMWYRLLLQHYSLKYGFQISYATEIGEGLYLGHLGSIIVNYEAKIGKNVNIAQGVTIGMTNRGENAGVPNIGNNVWIGANSVVVGGINIGNDVMIAPNTFVNFNVPDHSIVIAGKATILPRENATDKYINYEVNK